MTQTIPTKDNHQPGEIYVVRHNYSPQDVSVKVVLGCDVPNPSDVGIASTRLRSSEAIDVALRLAASVGVSNGGIGDFTNRPYPVTADGKPLDEISAQSDAEPVTAQHIEYEIRG